MAFRLIGNGKVQLIATGRGALVGVPNAVPPLLSDITYTQSYAPHPTHTNGTFGYVNPVGGIGPFLYEVAVNQALIYKVDPVLGYLYAWFYAVGAGSDTITIRVTDGRGTVVTKPITITKAASGSKVLGVSPQHNGTNNSVAPGFGVFSAGPLWQVLAYGGSHSSSDTIHLYNQGTVTPSPAVDWSSNLVRVHNYNTTNLAAGDYPLTVTTTDGTADTISTDVTLHVAQYANPSYIEFTQTLPLSTALPAGTQIGTVAATTPNNLQTWTCSDPLISIVKEGATGKAPIGKVVLTGSLPAGPRAIPFTVTDRLATFTQTYNVSVAVGTTLPSGNMTFPALAGLNLKNYNAKTLPTDPIPLGTPSVSGFPSGSTIQWIMSATERANYNLDVAGDNQYETRGNISFIAYSRYTCDPATGATACRAGEMSAGTDWFELTATDGLNVCTRQFTLTIGEYAGPVVYIGQGMATPANRTALAASKGLPAAGYGYEHQADYLQIVSNWQHNSTTAVFAGATVYIVYNSDLDYYGMDLPTYNTQQKGLNGPMKFVGVPGPGGELPRLGGLWRNPAWLSVEKSFFLCNHGDFLFRNLHLSDGYMGLFGGDRVPASDGTVSLIRQNTGKSGDITIDNCDLHDADVPLEAGASDGHWKITNTRLYNGAGCTSTAGANQHNAYLGMIWKITATNLLSYNAADGHVFKTRAMNGVWTNCRFFDGERGSGFNAVDLCNGGNHLFDGCVFEKGSMAQNPPHIQFAEEVGPGGPNNIGIEHTSFYVDNLRIQNCTFINHHSKTIDFVAAVNFSGKRNPATGAFSTATFTNNAFHGMDSTQVSADPFNRAGIYSHDFTPTITGSTFPTTYPVMDFTSPVSYDTGRPWWHNAIADLGSPARFPNMGGKQIDPGADELRVPVSAATGTVVCTLRAYGTPNYALSGNTQPDPFIDPFHAGSVWSFVNQPYYTGDNWHWTNADFPARYTITSNADGSGTIKTGTGAAAGCDILYVQVVNAGGTRTAGNPIFVVRT